MGLRVIANSMPALHNLPRQCRKRTHALPNQKKCSRRAVSFKKLQHSRRNNRIRPIIECNRHARPIIQSPQSRPKNLRTRRDRPPSIQTSSRTHPAHPKPSWIDRHPTSNFRTQPRSLPTKLRIYPALSFAVRRDQSWHSHSSLYAVAVAVTWERQSPDWRPSVAAPYFVLSRRSLPWRRATYSHVLPLAQAIRPLQKS